MQDIDRTAPPWLAPLDHPADEGVTVRAPDLHTLFARAAWAMFWCVTDPGAVRPEQERDVWVEAADREALLVRWLAELNRVHQTEELLFSRFDVRELTDQRLRAKVAGEPIDTERHALYMEIKGVTFHGLTLAKNEQGWTASILFDV